MIYFIQEEDSCYIKIGYSNSPFDRLKNLQTGNCRRLKIIGLVEGNFNSLSESSWQREYDKYRIKDKNGGTEWFKLPLNMIKSIKTNDRKKYPELWKQASINYSGNIKPSKSFIKNYENWLLEIGFDPINKMDNQQLYNANKYISFLFSSEEEAIKIVVKGQIIPINKLVS